MDKIWKIIKKFFTQPLMRFRYLSKLGVYNFMSDEQYLTKKFKLETGNDLDLVNPKTFNEKLQWLKLYNRKEVFTTMVDKYEVKRYVADKIGEDILIPTIGVYNAFEEIDFKQLPKQFVIKCTHDSGGIIICKDKEKLDILKTKKKINRFLRRKYYYVHREWPYKNVKPRVIIEKYMKNENEEELLDYKMFCFNGTVKFTLVCSGRFSQENMYESFYDIDWKLIPLTENNHPVDSHVKKPKSYKRMIQIAEILSKDLPFLRVDFYEIDKKPYFGELTFFPASGYEKFTPDKYNQMFGDWINLELVDKWEKDI